MAVRGDSPPRVGRSRIRRIVPPLDRTTEIQGGLRKVRQLGLRRDEDGSARCLHWYAPVRPQVYLRYEPAKLPGYRVDRLSRLPYDPVYDIPTRICDLRDRPSWYSLIRREFACSLPRTTLRTDRHGQNCKF